MEISKDEEYIIELFRKSDISFEKIRVIFVRSLKMEDTINELKNKVEHQEIMIDKMKCCGNCGYYNNDVECENNNRYIVNDRNKCTNFDMWILKVG